MIVIKYAVQNNNYENVSTVYKNGSYRIVENMGTKCYKKLPISFLNKKEALNYINKNYGLIQLEKNNIKYYKLIK